MNWPTRFQRERSHPLAAIVNSLAQAEWIASVVIRRMRVPAERVRIVAGTHLEQARSDGPPLGAQWRADPQAPNHRAVAIGVIGLGLGLMLMLPWRSWALSLALAVLVSGTVVAWSWWHEIRQSSHPDRFKAGAQAGSDESSLLSMLQDAQYGVLIEPRDELQASKVTGLLQRCHPQMVVRF